MGKATYIGVGNSSKKVKRMYIGVGNSSRKIKKGYIGVGGVARKFWGGELSKYGTINANNNTRLSGASNNSRWAIFGGGYNGTIINTVTAYDANLTKNTPDPLSSSRYGLNGFCINDLIFLGGGVISNSGNTSPIVDTYNTSLTKTQAQNMYHGYNYASSQVNNYGIFSGIRGGSVSCSFNEALTYTDIAAPNKSHYIGAGSFTQGHAIFAGGEPTLNGDAGHNNVSTYNSSLTLEYAASLPYSCLNLAGTTINDYAIFGGGSSFYGSWSAYDAVVVYNQTLTQTTITPLSQKAIDVMVGVSLDGFALITGGDGNTNVDCYDSNLIKTIASPLSSTTSDPRSASIGDYGLIGLGGTKVDVYQVK